LRPTKVNIVNEKIPIDIAKKLEIIKLQTHLIKGILQGFCFGQQEPLTVRITKLLESYPNFYDTFKELIQNADDAGATEIAFILDTRTHGCKQIFSEEFAALQGPALCVYNNRTFSEADLEALKKLGVGNKADEKFKVGKYGVGFNTVYHLTDAPQLLSNVDNWVIFDPLCKHFPDLVDYNPGYRIPFSITDNDHPFNQYNDVINSFIGDFADIKELANGTMFRLALRKGASKLSNYVFNEHDIERKVKENEAELKKSMIFLKNIKKLTFKKVRLDGKVETIIDLEKKFVESNDEIEYLKFIEYFKSSLIKPCMEIAKSIFQYNVRISDFKRNISHFKSDSIVIQDFHIIHQIGFETKSDFNETGKYFPLGSIAMPINSKEINDFHGSLYCFLPLPIPSPMPYHINGYFALINESRQGLYKLSDMTNEKLKWNQLIFNDIIASLMLEGLVYNRNLLQLKFMHQPVLMEENYLKHFPLLQLNERFLDSTLYMGDMIKHFYQKLFASDACLIPICKNEANSMVEWVSMKDKCLASSDKIKKWCDRTSSVSIVRHENKDEKYYVKLCNILINYGLKLCTFLNLTKHLNSIHCKNNPGVDVIRDLNSKDVLHFFKGFTADIRMEIQKTKFENEQNLVKILEFCLFEIGDRDLLNGIPLLLDATSKIQVFSKSAPIFTEKEYKYLKAAMNNLFIHV
jgi:sacsin